ncbi:vacuolar membrane protein [Cryptococcus neoformans Bt120]|nr:vacuolar membrane protein [Cryptococcus neoformans var. grubii Bt120]
MRSLSVFAIAICARSAVAGQSPFTFGRAPQVDSDIGWDQYNSQIYETTNSDVSTYASTIVSTLSSSPYHTTFLRLLQRAKCIPMLAHMENATVFAPTDQAWKEWAERNTPGLSISDADHGESVNGWLGPGGLDEWFRDEEEVILSRVAVSGDEGMERRIMDNQNWALRQHLLYHMFNYTLPLSSFLPSDVSNVTLQTTLLYPLKEQPPLPPVPEPGTPWLPQGGEGLLGGHGQRLRIARVGSKEGGEKGKVGVEWDGEGGVEIWDGKGWAKGNDSANEVPGARWVRNGVVVGIDGVLDMPPSIEEIIRTHPSLSYLSSILSLSSPPTPLPSSFSSTPHLTVFAPSNEAFMEGFDDIEKGYLKGPYGEEGVGRIVSQTVILGKDGNGVVWSDTLGEKNSEFDAISGEHLEISSSSSFIITVNNTSPSTPDILASNGVIHILPSLILSPSFNLLNSAEKMLLSLNATQFVSLMRSANLSEEYIGKDSKGGYTLLAPTDDVLDVLDKWDGLSTKVARELSNTFSDVSEKPSFPDPSPLSALLRYHILPQRLLPTDIVDGQLLSTELQTSSLKGARQKLRVEVAEKDGKEGKGKARSGWETVGQGEVRFGGATVLGKPVKSGNNVIYLISTLLSLPDTMLQTAVSDLQLSTFIAALYASDLAKTTKRLPAITYFIPQNPAFTDLGLAMEWLLTADGKDDLRKVVKYHMVEGIVYSEDVEDGKRIYQTVEGGDVVIERAKPPHGHGPGIITIGSPTKWPSHDSGSSLPSNGELYPANITLADSLTDTGVIHTIDQVVLPSDVDLTVGKLIKGSKQLTMSDLMVRAGLGWILEGREPSKEEVQKAELEGRVRSWDEDEDGDGDEGKEDDLAYPAYIVLCPSDKAFSKLNLTHYISTPPALLSLLKLHIIPSSSLSLSSSLSSAVPPQNGQPLALNDDSIYKTLLSTSSKYGDLAFRGTGDGNWIVGIKDARGGGRVRGDSARVGMAGRASVRWKNPRTSATSNSDDNGEEEKDPKHRDGRDRLWEGGMTLGGGVMMIDSVLIPYEPSWFSRWGLLTITLAGISILLLAAAGSIGYWFWTRRKDDYMPILVEEDGEPEGEEHA